MTPIITTMTPSAATLIVPKRFCQSLLFLIPNHLSSEYSATGGHDSLLPSVLSTRGDPMKKCPSCYAIMHESTQRTTIPGPQQKPTDGTPEVSAIRVRYECRQCGHTEESFAKPAPAVRHG